jgi:hypothetical protein
METPVDEPLAVEMIISILYHSVDNSTALEALRKFNGNLDAAVNYLLNEQISQDEAIARALQDQFNNEQNTTTRSYPKRRTIIRRFDLQKEETL